MEPAKKPVMDIAPPPKATPASPPPASAGAPAVSASSTPASAPNASSVHPAPVVPGDENGDASPVATTPGSDAKPHKKEPTHTQKPDAPRAAQAPKGPAGVIVVTIFFMLLLAGLAIAVYSTSAK